MCGITDVHSHVVAYTERGEDEKVIDELERRERKAGRRSFLRCDAKGL